MASKAGLDHQNTALFVESIRAKIQANRNISDADMAGYMAERSTSLRNGQDKPAHASAQETKDLAIIGSASKKIIAVDASESQVKAGMDRKTAEEEGADKIYRQLTTRGATNRTWKAFADAFPHYVDKHQGTDYPKLDRATLDNIADEPTSDNVPRGTLASQPANQTIINKKTGQRMVLKDGAWVPMP
jgi:hypothetical protein